MTSSDDSIGNNPKSGSLSHQDDRTVCARAVSDDLDPRLTIASIRGPLSKKKAPLFTNEMLGPRGLYGSQAWVHVL